MLPLLLWISGYLILGFVFSSIMYMLDLDNFEAEDIWFVTISSAIYNRYVNFLNNHRAAVRTWRNRTEEEVEELEVKVEKQKSKKEPKKVVTIPAIPTRNNLQSVE